MAEVTAVKPEETLGGGLVEKMAAEVEIKPKADIKLSPFTVFKAAEAINKVVEESQKSKSSLIEENIPIQLQYNFKKIPQMKNKRLHAPIPHTLVTRNTDVCLFVKDVHQGADDQEDKRDFTPSVRHFRKIVEEASSQKVEEIIPVIQLKREYRDFEMQRKLCASFDVFLCDERISKFLPKLLGKTFHKKRKLPINVKLDGAPSLVAKSLKKAFDSVHGLITGKGSSTSVTLSHTGLTAQQTTDNVLAVVNHMVRVIPGGWANISGLYLTSTKTTSIPLYVSTTSAASVQLPPDVVQRRRLIASGDPGLFGDDDDDENDDENDKKEGIVHVFDDGTVKIGGDADDADEDSTALSGREKENRRKKNSAVKKPAPAKKNGNKGKKNGHTSPASSTSPAKRTKPDDGEKRGEETTANPPKKTTKGGKKKKKSPATGTDSPAETKTRIAATKGPLSKKPRLQ